MVARRTQGGLPQRVRSGKGKTLQDVRTDEGVGAMLKYPGRLRPGAGKPAGFEQLIFFVTSRCNARCKGCFYWRNLNRREEELQLDEIERIAASVGKLRSLLLSGGEPTLRDDLPEIIRVFERHTGMTSVGMPTNGLLPGKTETLVRQTLSNTSRVRLEVNLSLDALGKKHDELRGVPGNFEKTVETAGRLADLAAGDRRLRVNVETVISNANLRDIPGLIEFVRKELDVRAHYFEVLRGDPRLKEMAPPGAAELTWAQRLVLANHTAYIGDSQKGRHPGELTIIRELYRVQRRVLAGKRSPVCVAGDSVAVLEADGTVRLCELTDPVGNVRQHEYSLPVVLSLDTARALRRRILSKRCSCTHCVFQYQNIRRTFRYHLSRALEPLRSALRRR